MDIKQEGHEALNSWPLIAHLSKQVKVNLGSQFKNFGSTCIHNAIYQVSRPSVYLFWRRFLKFLPYMAMVAILVM